MFNGGKRRIVFAGAAVLGAVIIVLVFVRLARHGPPGSERGTPSSSGGPSSARSDFPTNGGGDDGGGPDSAAARAALAAANVPPVEKQIENLMGVWRTGILNKDADAVVAADEAFRGEPKKFREALMTSAETDADDRVRAFSTRVLGKLHDPTCAPLLVRLLNDKSQYVRMNAAWGLGELASTAEGRTAARPGLRLLRRLEKQEPAKDTREAAAQAAKRLM
ncbi:MAG: hypothetical protein QOI66_2504 [Myxococcales bacterium]|jgi:hypothetical protein|nr:hypothetical protein [Myxococcales bacterium]